MVKITDTVFIRYPEDVIAIVGREDGCTITLDRNIENEVCCIFVKGVTAEQVNEAIEANLN